MLLALTVAFFAACGPAVASEGSVIAGGTTGSVATPAPTSTSSSAAAAVSPASTTRVTTAPATAAPAAGFNAGSYIGKGDMYNCDDFISQAQAQAVLRADPRDPNRLDTDKDGIACESLKGAQDRVPVPRS